MATRAPSDPRARVDTLRPDIQALRALAVTSVVLFHLWPNRIPGGFVGVDVFFVISGYLITDHLVRDIEQAGTVRLGRFWAARARRLLPASLLTLFLTAAAVVLLVPRSLWDQFLSEVIASASYVQNWLLASNAVDYLAAENVPSPAQHFWSLSVEEQFYVALPLLLVLSILVSRLVRVGPTRVVSAVLVAVAVASFAYCLQLTVASPDVAYFSTFTRMWEFALGGLASFAKPAAASATKATATARQAVTAVGALAIAVSFFVITSDTPFPGYAAVLPVLGTLVVVRWGGPTFVATLGALQPAAELGRTSYALYLWHWPLIVLVPFLTFRDLGTTDKLLILAAALALSAASTRLVEEPIRFSHWRRARPRTVLVATLVTMIPVLLLPIAGQAVVDRDRSSLSDEAAQVLARRPACLGAASMDPDHPGCVNPELSDMVVPAPAVARPDRIRRHGCMAALYETRLKFCPVEPPGEPTLRLLAVGDSHNRTLMPAYLWMAEHYGWRIDVMGRAGCYWTTAEQDREGRPAVQRKLCDEWRADVARHIDTTRYDAIITTHATAVNLERRPGLTYEQTTVQGMVEAWRRADVPIVAIVDNPQAEPDNTPCVERFGRTNPGRCAADRSWALRRFDGHAEAVAQVDRASLVDMTDFYCRRTKCPSVIGGVMVYRDHTHLTATYVTTLAPYLGRDVRAALREQGVVGRPT